MDISQAEIEAVTKALIDEGKLIEAGWIGLQEVFMPPDAPAEQVRDMRMAFFAGAQHLFMSIITMLELGDDDPSENDEKRMDMIHQELMAWGAEFEKLIFQPTVS